MPASEQSILLAEVREKIETSHRRIYEVDGLKVAVSVFTFDVEKELVSEHPYHIFDEMKRQLAKKLSYAMEI